MHVGRTWTSLLYTIICDRKPSGTDRGHAARATGRGGVANGVKSSTCSADYARAKENPLQSTGWVRLVSRVE